MEKWGSRRGARSLRVPPWWGSASGVSGVGSPNELGQASHGAPAAISWTKSKLLCVCFNSPLSSPSSLTQSFLSVNTQAVNLRQFSGLGEL